MNIGEIIKDGITYPLVDLTDSLKLAIPNIFVVIATVIFIFTTGTDVYFSLNYFFIDPSQSSLSTATYIILTLILLIINVIYWIYNLGVVSRVFENTMMNKREVPYFDLKRIFDKGSKLFIIYLIFILICCIINLYIEFIVYINITLLVLMAFVPAILAVFSQTNSISKTLDIKRIWEITKEIGIKNTAIFMVLLLIITIIFGLLAYFCSYIALVIILLFVELIMARIAGLLYVNRTNNMTSND